MMIDMFYLMSAWKKLWERCWAEAWVEELRIGQGVRSRSRRRCLSE